MGALVEAGQGYWAGSGLGGTGLGQHRPQHRRVGGGRVFQGGAAGKAYESPPAGQQELTVPPLACSSTPAPHIPCRTWQGDCVYDDKTTTKHDTTSKLIIHFLLYYTFHLSFPCRSSQDAGVQRSDAPPTQPIHKIIYIILYNVSPFPFPFPVTPGQDAGVQRAGAQGGGEEGHGGAAAGGLTRMHACTRTWHR
jgi:hypothetical protein